MKKTLSPVPPKWPLSLLRLFIKKDYLEEIEGDMEEVFRDNLELFSVKKAQRKYVWEVIRLLRPALTRKLSGTQRLNNGMIRHNLLLTVRNFMRYKNSFFINLTGLSTGLACAFLILLWVQDELRIDKFHEKDDRLYQVMHNLNHTEKVMTITSTPAKLASAMAAEIPEVELAASVIPTGWSSDNGILSIGDKVIKAKEQYASEDYFNVFSFKLLDGDKSTVLSQKNGIAISDELALKLFDTTDDLVGKSLEWKKGEFSGQYQITGVFEKPPKVSSSQFDLVFQFQLFVDNNTYLEQWWNSDPSTYVILKEGTDLAAVNSKVEKFIQTKIERSSSTLFMHKYSDRYLNGQYENGKVAGGRIQYVRLFSMIAILILTIACINFMNLSTARASRRFKEIGVKKAIGVGRRALIAQYLGESVLLSFASLLVAVLITVFFLPTFNQIVEKSLSIQFQYEFVIAVLLITLITGLVSGMYPAFYLSKFKAVNILKGAFDLGGSGSRKGLVVFQFSVSIMLIISVVVIYKQLEFIQSKNLGYDRDNIIIFNNDGELGENLETFLARAKDVPGVINAAAFGHDLMGDHGGTSGLRWEGKDPEVRIGFGNLEVGYDFIETVSIQMLEGRTYSRDFQAEQSKIIFNKAAIDAMGLSDPIGKKVSFWGRERQIIGVSTNFHYESLYKDVEPCFFLLGSGLSKTMVKIRSGTESASIDAIHNLYKEFNEDLPFEYNFLDDDYQAMYNSEQQIATLSKYFCGITILISCLGLFGLVAFTSERRLKEIGIRKILGSGSFRIVYMLSSDFTKMVLLAIFIALPLSYFLARFWLDGFVYRISLEWWFFVLAGFIALVIAWMTVGIQTFKAANINPVQCLRDE